MSRITIISIFYLIGYNAASYLEKDDTAKPKLEKNNIVNKGVWIKKIGDDQPSKTISGDFIFRSSSLDADSLLHNNFDPFGDSFMQDSVMVPNYVERSKRSAKDVPFSNRSAENKTGIVNNDNNDKSTFVKSKLRAKGQPESVYKDYPYEVAIMLANNKRELTRPKGLSSKDMYEIKEHNYTKNTPDITVSIDKLVQSESRVLKQKNGTNTRHNTTIVIPKRSMQHDYESEIIKKIEFSEELNKTEDSYETNKMDRNVFEGDDRAWHQTAPVPDVNTYKILPKPEENKNKNKPMTEKGLVKVLSMLTKTFKKVMKQHNDIKRIHTKLTSINDEFMKNAQLLMTKFQDFDVKYLYLMKFNENLKDLEARLRSKEEFYSKKETELTKNLAEFEGQQKKFLIQQQQFYNIQKLMLAQNEKINLKQNLIAKTQNEISLRQNNFARILKKAKQIYIDTKNPIPQKLSAILSKPKENNGITNNEGDKSGFTSTTPTPNTESIKINLFSVPSITRIINYDNQLLKEKDDHPVDDLIYKYYFNNTYIDVLMKNKILSSFVPAPGISFTRNAKNKRNENPAFVQKSTNLIPVNEIKTFTQKGKPTIQLNRGKRWIKYSKNSKRRHIGRDLNIIPKKEDVKLSRNKTEITIERHILNKVKTKMGESDPFYTMAASFCKEVGQNGNDQMLHWCIEKALRRLRSIDMKVPHPTNTGAWEITGNKGKPSANSLEGNSKTKRMTTTSGEVATSAVPSSNPQNIIDSATTASIAVDYATDSALFFPDNDQLESNLKDFDLKPDTEGTVYYEGSVHASQYDGPDSDGASDLMPGLDSDSRVDIDPVALDLQQRRHAYVRRINEDIMRQAKRG
ncbi:cytadherence high molecular weight protein 2-like [Battus philenor]|uniref:cytadherence high molecular weight protein 2-like n=1 Tax=Battus philenor TaxID=42288 RepID=UPI0035CF6BC1